MENVQKNQGQPVKSSPANDAVVKISGLKKNKDRKSAGAFRTISEVANELGVAQHVLRFWESKFTQVKPLKRGGGRRYYRPEDVALLRHVHYLLHTAGYTIKGVQKLFKGQTKNQIVAGLIDKGSVETLLGRSGGVSYADTPEQVEQKKVALTTKQRSILEAMLGELKEMRSIVGKK